MEIRVIAVVGGGTMGAGISRAVAAAGFQVLLFEKAQAAADKSKQAIDSALEHDLSRWALTALEKDAIAQRIHVGVELSEADRADLVIEALPEDFAIKIDVFKALDRICHADCVFITNTSTLSVSELAGCTQRPDRMVGLHFVNPVPRTRVVEVVRGMATSGQTIKTARDLASKLDKVPIEVCEYPGYVTTRVILPMINEAIHVVMEGVATAQDVDTAIKLGYNFESGPLRLADQMGLDEVLKSMEHLFHELGDLKYRPCPLLRKMVRAGRLGLKSGEGFFKHDPPPGASFTLSA